MTDTWLSAEEVGGVPAGLVQRAKDLATRAHAGQVDKAGRPYIEHVARVAAEVADDPEAEAVAWLHDVLEDCEGYASKIGIEFPLAVRQAVVCVTRYPQDSPRHYYASILSNQLALRVKLADIADNSDESRLALLDDKTAARLRRKYAKAREALGAA
jgi:(p)ppGpp synthase/HD superfamily hydrolase